jgi:predicted NodU family carbamoyl transferase
MEVKHNLSKVPKQIPSNEEEKMTSSYKKRKMQAEEIVSLGYGDKGPQYIEKIRQRSKQKFNQHLKENSKEDVIPDLNKKKFKEVDANELNNELNKIVEMEENRRIIMQDHNRAHKIQQKVTKVWN